jgi:hypothetical protein
MNQNIKYYKPIINKYYTNKCESDNESNHDNSESDEDDNDNESDIEDVEDEDDDDDIVEIFKRIDEFDNYSISNHGNVRNDTTNRILKPSKNSDGYHNINLYKDKKAKNHSVHRLVGLA